MKPCAATTNARRVFRQRGFSGKHTKGTKILIVLRYAQRLQWLRVKTKAKRPKASVARKRIGSSRPATRKTAARDKIRLLIADDHALILEGLAATIGRQDDMTVVAKASNGREAVELWSTHRPDVSLLDLRMPKLNGVGVIREVRDLDVSARVIVHTTYDTDEEIYQAIRAGAKAYLLKDAPLEELLDAIRKVHAGKPASPLP